MSSTCVRCGVEYEDLRTLEMACFYDMDEMQIPFEIVSCGGKLRYTLRVCKGCRSEWMQDRHRAHHRYRS